MVKVDFYNPNEFEIPEDKIRSSIANVLKENEVNDASVSVAVVDELEMNKYVEKYYKDSNKHPVLAFPTNEVPSEFLGANDEKNYLGEIILVFASESDMVHWAEHGALHLIGVHHD